FLAPDVAGHGEGGATDRRDLSDRRLARLGLAAADDHLRAVRGHLLGDRLADATAGTGDEGNLPLQVEKRHGDSFFAAAGVDTQRVPAVYSVAVCARSSAG